MQAQVIITIPLLVETDCSLRSLKRRAPESSPWAKERPNNEGTGAECLQLSCFWDGSLGPACAAHIFLFAAMCKLPGEGMNECSLVAWISEHNGVSFSTQFIRNKLRFGSPLNSNGSELGG